MTICLLCSNSYNNCFRDMRLKDIIINSKVLRKLFDEVKEHALNKIDECEHSWDEGLDDDTRIFAYVLSYYQVHNGMK